MIRSDLPTNKMRNGLQHYTAVKNHVPLLMYSRLNFEKTRSKKSLITLFPDPPISISTDPTNLVSSDKKILKWPNQSFLGFFAHLV